MIAVQIHKDVYLLFLHLCQMLTSLPHDTAVHSGCQKLQNIESSRILRMLLCRWRKPLCVCVWGECMGVCGRLLCQAGEAVRNSSTHLGIKLMCWDQGPAPRKLFLWLQAVIEMGSGWTLASEVAEEPNTCRSLVPGTTDTYISIHPLSLVVISVISNGSSWWDNGLCFLALVAKNQCLGAVLQNPLCSICLQKAGWDNFMVNDLCLN